MDKKLHETTNLGLEIVYNNRQVNRKNGQVVQIPIPTRILSIFIAIMQICLICQM